jgi:two-component system phosphate regulon sensor histidine kinase PhoR
MLSGPFVRRVVVPYAGLLLWVGGAVAAFAATRAPGAPGDRAAAAAIAWFAVGCAVAAVVAAVAIAYAYARWQKRWVAEMFGTIAPAGTDGADSVDGVLQSTADKVRTVVTQASNDKAQLLTILSNMSNGLIAIDPAQEILLMNRAAERLLGIREADVRGRPLYETMVPREILGAVNRANLTGEPATAETGPVEGRLLEITVSRLPAADRAGGSVIVLHDVTESRRYEDLRKEFVANVSHELRTPLTMIKGFVETLRDGAIDDRERALQYLATVERHSDQLTNLVNDLLDLSRLDSAVDIPRSGIVYLDATLHRVAELAQPAAAKKRHELVFDVQDDLPPVAGNADYLQRAITNLVDNAIKYTREGGGVSVSARQAGRQVVVEVKDNGIGIPQDDLGRIFERFYRVDRSRSRDMGGTGLGLSIVKHVVQTHGGTVEVESRLGAGSAFRIRLPASRELANAAVAKN